jgi:hypothetical protein
MLRSLYIRRKVSQFKKKELHGLSPRVKYTDRATACRRSWCQLLWIWGIAWSAQRIPYGYIIWFLDRSRYYFFQVAPQLYSRGWANPDRVPVTYWKAGWAGALVAWTLWKRESKPGPAGTSFFTHSISEHYEQRLYICYYWYNEITQIQTDYNTDFSTLVLH